MLKHKLVRPWWVGFVCLVGCYPATELAPPRIVTPGHVQAIVASTPPQVGVFVGVAKRVDVGLRLSPIAAEVGPRVALMQSERDGEFDLTIGASFTKGFEGSFPYDDNPSPGTNLSWTGGRVPIMLGYRGSDLSPWVSVTTHLGAANSKDDREGRIDHGAYVLLSSAVGLDLKLRDWVTMQLQVAYLQPLAGIDAPNAKLGPDDRRFAAQLGFRLGYD